VKSADIELLVIISKAEREINRFSTVHPFSAMMSIK